MNIVTRPGMNQTLQEARWQKEEARQQAVADLSRRRDGRDESIGAINEHCRQQRHAQRRRLDGRAAAAELAERVYGNLDDEAAT
jgi:hypothetical protein